ncbi:ComF family protein [Sphaerotilus hippei]|uniref:ComF family protein n=1 Tax=Sphaerotilus hippei TaxID=744406 RepID=A0A318H0P6_9BURK|nr:phosphoribosyltransferase family protein [Sphaerotilus hippei]PXW95759.1 ComF family protein [Sphaerotilus hippei]
MIVRDKGWLAGWRTLLGGGRCQVCRAAAVSPLCADCLGRHARPLQRCRLCGVELGGEAEVCGACLWRPPPCSRTVVALPYRYPWDGLIVRLKFHAAVELAAPLADLLAEAVLTARACAPEAQPRPELILPVALSSPRQQERGYNQSWELARRVATRLQCPARPDLLERVRCTVPQLSLPRARRLLNVRGAFRLTPQGLGLVRGRRVVLVDDVMTTGATLTAAAEALQAAGAADIRFWVLARTSAD